MTQKEAEARAARPSHATAPVIVVGLDGSPTSWDAFSWAAGEATRSNGNLVAVYVTPAVEPVAVFGESLGYSEVEKAREEVAGRLRDEAERRAGNMGLHVRFVWERGDTATAITRFARSLGADLIVVGRSAKVLHHLAGSLGRRLVSRHDAPVIVVVP
jgi:nucleotide-binding universal stress UspA family protein